MQTQPQVLDRWPRGPWCVGQGSACRNKVLCVPGSCWGAVTVPVPTGDPSTAGSWGQEWEQGSNTPPQNGCSTALEMVRCEKRSSCTRLTLDAPDLADGFVFGFLKSLHWEQHPPHTPRGCRRLCSFSFMNKSALWITQAGVKVTLLRKSNNYHITHLPALASHTCANSSPSWVPGQFPSPLSEHKPHQFCSGSFAWCSGKKEPALKKSSFPHQH